MKQKVYIAFLSWSICISVSVFAQDKTRATPGSSTNSVGGKIMLVPFEPKLYMSEIDKKVHDQTNWTFNQIRENFRHQLDIQLQQKFKPFSPVVSFYKDSAKMAKDLLYLYGSKHYSYEAIDKPTASATKTVASTGIKNGQVEVEMNDDKKFFTVTIDNKETLAYFNKKYGADYFVFINQLDIKTDPNSYNITTNTYQRKVDIHYTILDKNTNLITAGIASSYFSSKENSPKKIVDLSFSPAARFIADKFIAAVKPVPVSKTK